MANLSDYAENKVLDHMLGTTAWTHPTQAYVKLHIGAPGETGTGNPAAEATRKAVDFSAASGGATSNSGAVTWTNVAATETITHITLWDASTGGNCLMWMALTSSVALTAGDDFSFPIGDIDVTAA